MTGVLELIAIVIGMIAGWAEFRNWREVGFAGLAAGIVTALLGAIVGLANMLNLVGFGFDTVATTTFFEVLMAAFLAGVLAFIGTYVGWIAYEAQAEIEEML